MSLPDYQTLMAPVLRLTAEGHERVPDMLPVIARAFALDTEAMSFGLGLGRAGRLPGRAGGLTVCPWFIARPVSNPQPGRLQVMPWFRGVCGR